MNLLALYGLFAILSYFTIVIAELMAQWAKELYLSKSNARFVAIGNVYMLAFLSAPAYVWYAQNFSTALGLTVFGFFAGWSLELLQDALVTKAFRSPIAPFLAKTAVGWIGFIAIPVMLYFIFTFKF